MGEASLKSFWQSVCASRAGWVRGEEGEADGTLAGEHWDPSYGSCRYGGQTDTPCVSNTKLWTWVSQIFSWWLLPTFVCSEREKELHAVFHFLKIHTVLDFWKMVDVSDKVLWVAKSHEPGSFPRESSCLKTVSCKAQDVQLPHALWIGCVRSRWSLMWLLRNWVPGNSLVLASHRMEQKVPSDE